MPDDRIPAIMVSFLPLSSPKSLLWTHLQKMAEAVDYRRYLSIARLLLNAQQDLFAA